MNEVITAVVIDDEEQHVWKVSDALGRNGIATFPIHYTEARAAFEYCKGVAKSNPRVIITDIQINRSGGGKDPTTTDYSNIASCIENLISKMTGPYIVLAWTDQIEHLEKLKEYVYAYLEKRGINKPFYFDAIDKVQCRKDDSSTDFCVDKIFSSFVTHLSEQKQISALMGWEKLVNRSAHETVNSLVSMAGENLRDVIYSLGYQVAGSNLAGNECAAINESLIYILKDELGKVSNYPENSKIWKEALEQGTTEEAKELKHQLNTLLHIDREIKSGIICPGDTWVIGTDALFRNMTMPKQAKVLMKEIKKEVVIYSESGLELSNKISELDRNSPRYDELKNELEDKFEKVREKFLGECQLVAIEISPQCDFSNKKKRLKSVVLGILVPAESISENLSIKKSDSLISLPIIYQDSRFFMIVSAKYTLSFSDSLINHESTGMSKIFRVRENMLQSWIQFISSYNARIGTVSFH